MTKNSKCCETVCVTKCVPNKNARVSKLDRLEYAFQIGEALTAHDIITQYGLANPIRAVHDLRRRGVCIFTKKKSTACGKDYYVYQIGLPTREMISFLHVFGFFRDEV